MCMHIIVSSFGVLWNCFTFSLGDMEKNQEAVYTLSPLKQLLLLSQKEYSNSKIVIQICNANFQTQLKNYYKHLEAARIRKWCGFTIYRLKVEKFLRCQTQLRSMFQSSDKASGKGDEIKILYIKCEKIKTQTKIHRNLRTRG